jgi:uncharacterized membrane protein YkoI
MLRRTLVLALFASASGLFANAARADEETDSARARTALARGEIRPLAGILTAVEERYEGRVIETELEYRHAVWTYEFKLLPPTGRIFKVRIDAASGRMLETHGPVRERP